MRVSRGLIFLLVAILLVSPAMAVPWCAQQDLFFHNDSSDITGYMILDNVPQIADQTMVLQSVSSSTGEKILGTWITPVGSPGVTTLAPGLWRFRTYTVASSASGITAIKFYAINRSASGVETNLFYGNAITQDINGGGVPSEFLTSYARRNYTTFFPGDRLVIRANASTTGSAVRTVRMELAGNTNASMVSVVYFLCPESSGDSDGGAPGLVFGMIGGLTGAVLIAKRGGFK